MTMTAFIASPTTLMFPVRMFNAMRDCLDPPISPVQASLFPFTAMLTRVTDCAPWLRRPYAGESAA